jgi:hypothetical protein
MLAPGQDHDLTCAEPLLENVDPDALLGDKTFDADPPINTARTAGQSLFQTFRLVSLHCDFDRLQLQHSSSIPPVTIAVQRYQIENARWISDAVPKSGTSKVCQPRPLPGARRAIAHVRSHLNVHQDEVRPFSHRGPYTLLAIFGFSSTQRN